MTTETLDDLKAAREKQKQGLADIDKKIDAKLAQTLVQCTSNCRGTGCGMGMQIKELVYIQTRWYTHPSGCTGGDYWNNGEGNFECLHCGHLNRLYDRPEIEKLSHLFSSIAVRCDK